MSRPPSPSASRHAERAFARARRRHHAVRPAVVAAALGTALACGRDEPKRPGPPPSAAVAPAPALPAAPVQAWDDAAGLGLVVRVGSGQAMLVTPGAGDARQSAARTAAGDAGGVLLFGRGGLLGHAHADSVGGAPLAGACTTWSAVRVGPASGADAMPAWSVGFVVPAGTPAPAALPLDSLDVLSSRDSAAFAAAVTRLAASLPDTGGRGGAQRPALHSVPFRVRDAHRFTLDDGARGAVAIVTRTLNVEAAPFAEVILVVAEQRAQGPWQLAYAESAAGAEESLPAMDVLAAVQFPARAALVLARDADDGSRYTLLERDAPGRWRAHWTSATCGASPSPLTGPRAS